MNTALRCIKIVHISESLDPTKRQKGSSAVQSKGGGKAVLA